MVEPATGRQYVLADAPYDGVEAVWNARNFWACLQMPQPHSDARARPAGLACDLADAAALGGAVGGGGARPEAESRACSCFLTPCPADVSCDLPPGRQNSSHRRCARDTNMASCCPGQSSLL